MEKIEKNKSIYFILLIVIIALQIWIICNIHDDKADRINRVETLMEYDSFKFGQYGVDENMTLGYIKAMYIGGHKTYMFVFTNMALGYVCDGTNEEIFNYLK